MSNLIFVHLLGVFEKGCEAASRKKKHFVFFQNHSKHAYSTRIFKHTIFECTEQNTVCLKRLESIKQHIILKKCIWNKLANPSKVFILRNHWLLHVSFITKCFALWTAINFNLIKTITFFKLSRNLLNIPNFRINMGHFIAKDSYIPTM